MFHIIYKITNKLNGHYYYGVHSTNNLDDGYMGSGKLIIKAIQKHGIENFNKEIISFFDDRTSALFYENKIVNLEMLKDKNCYNICEGGNAPPSRKGKISEKTLLLGDNRTEKQKEASKNHSEKMKSKTPWNKNIKGKQIAWNKNIPNPKLKEFASIERTCPHCGKFGKGSSMLRWHFDNCRMGS